MVGLPYVFTYGAGSPPPGKNGANSASASKIAIVNRALVKVGQNRISSLDENSKSATSVRAVYDQVCNTLMQSYVWNFTKTRVQLAADTVAPLFGFQFRYRLPTGTLRVLGIADAQEPQRNYTSSLTAFKHEDEFIYTDAGAPLNLVICQKITDTGKYPPDFCNLLALDIALDIFYDVTKGTERYAAIRQDRAVALRNAKMNHAIENSPEVMVASEWIDSRYADTPYSGYRLGPVL